MRSPVRPCYRSSRRLNLISDGDLISVTGGIRHFSREPKPSPPPSRLFRRCPLQFDHARGAGFGVLQLSLDNGAQMHLERPVFDIADDPRAESLRAA